MRIPLPEPGEKWCIVGTGPSFREPGEEFRTITLNRALLKVERDPDMACIGHTATFEACEGQLGRIRGWLLVSDPILADPGLVKVREYELIQEELGPTRIIPYPRKGGVPKELKELTWRLKFCHEKTVGTLAMSWLIAQGVKEFWSVGVDGGRDVHQEFAASYENRPGKHNPEYDKGVQVMAEIARNCRVVWHKL